MMFKSLITDIVATMARSLGSCKIFLFFRIQSILSADMYIVKRNDDDMKQVSQAGALLDPMRIQNAFHKNTNSALGSETFLLGLCNSNFTGK